MVFVERLPIVIGHEEGAAEDVEDAAVVDVGVRVVDEDAGFGVARRVDVEVVAPACDAAAHELAVVLEVHRVERDVALLRAEIPDALQHILALGRGGHQFRRSLVTHRHVMEVEAEMRALVAEHPHEVVAGDGLKVVPRVADGRPEEDAVGLQQIHRVHDGGVVAIAPPGIVGGRRALDGEHKGDVAQLYHLLTERLVDEGRVGVDGELHIVVPLR